MTDNGRNACIAIAASTSGVPGNHSVCNPGPRGKAGDGIVIRRS
jgi:hypothetical protein